MVQLLRCVLSPDYLSQLSIHSKATTQTIHKPFEPVVGVISAIDENLSVAIQMRRHPYVIRRA